MVIPARSPSIRSIDKDHCFAIWDRVLIQMWQGVATVQAAEALERVGRVFIAETKGGQLNCLSIVGSRSPPPNDKVRVRLSACYRAFEPSVAQQIWVAEGSGFRAALVRGVGLAVSTLAPSLLPMKFAASVDEAARMIGPHLSPASGGSEMLKTAVEAVRAEIERQSTGT